MDKIRKIVKKPWGQEEWVALTDKYCLKIIDFKKGYRTSLQYHDFKEETNYVDSGKILWWQCEKDGSNLTKTEMNPGDRVSVGPGEVHRVEALEDTRMIEVSTPHVDDVIRLEDDFERPDGRIESEHGTR